MAVQIVMKIDDLKGESQVDGYKDWIDVLDWGWDVQQSGTFHMGGGGTGGVSQFSDLRFTKYVDKSSADLMKSVALGSHFGKATMIVRKSTGSTPLDYYILTMTKVLVRSYQTGGSKDGLDRIEETIELNFAQIKVEYYVQDEKGVGSLGGEFEYSTSETKEV